MRGYWQLNESVTVYVTCARGSTAADHQVFNIDGMQKVVERSADLTYAYAIFSEVPAADVLKLTFSNGILY